MPPVAPSPSHAVFPSHITTCSSERRGASLQPIPPPQWLARVCGVVDIKSRRTASFLLLLPHSLPKESCHKRPRTLTRSSTPSASVPRSLLAAVLQYAAPACQSLPLILVLICSRALKFKFLHAFITANTPPPPETEC